MWSDNEVKALIPIWGEANVQEELDGAIRNEVVYLNISRKMKEQGYDRDSQQCRTKNRKSEKRDYNYDNKISQWSNKTGQKVLQVLQGTRQVIYRPVSVPAVLLDSGTINSIGADSEDSVEERKKWYM